MKSFTCFSITPTQDEYKLSLGWLRSINHSSRRQKPDSRGCGLSKTQIAWHFFHAVGRYDEILGLASISIKPVTASSSPDVLANGFGGPFDNGSGEVSTGGAWEGGSIAEPALDIGHVGGVDGRSPYLDQAMGCWNFGNRDRRDSQDGLEGALFGEPKC